ncbi:hypothetical protein NDU88_009622 [Pleurodeles waltl]|uniref:Uncharacterized protein n=1 Tax=Pleurodeles waltl TaxID=8319 RepID=A0AAV7S0Y6_PLEWA|nr:hypothetical protein NDU88_009622 [Pleurodeles waltl]
MWITKNGQSKDLYDTEDRCLFLDGLTTTAMDLTPPTLPSGLPEDSLSTLSSHASVYGRKSCDGMTQHRGRDLERPMRPHSDRDQALLAVAHQTQQPDRDKSRSPLKPMTAPK